MAGCNGKIWKTGTLLCWLLALSLPGPFALGQGTQTPSTPRVNPVVPGYFADPTIKKFGDIYYIYATTDNEMLASGVPTVWYSRDLEHWYNHTMEVPSLDRVQLRNFWAPDILQGGDGRYYLYFGNCQAGCNIYGYVSKHPVGPWEKLSGADTPVIAHNYPRAGFPSLDAQFFRDDDGKIYAYWGTWVHYNGGYAVGELDPLTMASIKNPRNIPLEQTPNPFEAPYMLKKGKKYILMYSGGSCHDQTYHVNYSHADNPYGPFVPGENNPILASSADGSLHGPGHHSVLREGDRYYIAYHNHDWPMTRGGLSRQICLDELVFENDSTLKKVRPKSGTFRTPISPGLPGNLALGAGVTASSFYEMDTPEQAYVYRPEFATDDHNATMWKAGDNSFPQHLTVDLGRVRTIERVMLQFEFASYYYQYRLEYSTDGKTWKTYADRSGNQTPGSPLIDDGRAAARYLRLTVLDVEKTGLYAALWNIKVYGSRFEVPLDLRAKASPKGPSTKPLGKKLVEIQARDLPGGPLDRLPNRGHAGGNLVREGEVALIRDDLGIPALEFTKGALVLDRPVPKSLEWNGSFTVATWVRNPQIDSQGECLLSWCDRFRFKLANSYSALHYNKGPYGAAAHLDPHFDMRYNSLPTKDIWHHIVLTFDGVVEKLYVDGKLDHAQIMVLASQVENAKIRIGASDVGEHFSGLMASMALYDRALTQGEILELLEGTRPKAVD